MSDQPPQRRRVNRVTATRSTAPAGSDDQPEPRKFTAWAKKSVGFISTRTGALIGVILLAVVTAIGVGLGDTVKAKIFGGPDYTITAELNEDLFEWSRAHYFFAKPVTELSIPPSDTRADGKFYQWAQSNGGQDFKMTIFRLTVHARSKPVSVVGASLIDVQTIPPQRGAYVASVVGGQQEVRAVLVDLNDRMVRYVPKTLAGLEPSDFVFALEPGQSEFFNVKAEGEKCNCEWRLKLALMVDGRPVTHIVDASGKPFRTLSRTLNEASYPYWSPETGWQE